jgi:hypothetical protein
MFVCYSAGFAMLFIHHLVRPSPANRVVESYVRWLMVVVDNREGFWKDQICHVHDTKVATCREVPHPGVQEREHVLSSKRRNS